jgi:hypothetical protein
MWIPDLHSMLVRQTVVRVVHRLASEGQIASTFS